MSLARPSPSTYARKAPCGTSEATSSTRSVRSTSSRYSPKVSQRAIHADVALERDQSVWGLVADYADSCAATLISSIEQAPTERLQISGLLALQKVAHLDADRVAGFLAELASDKERVQLAEWARLHLNDLQVALGKAPFDILGEPVSSREFVYEPGRRFDTTMPLIFHCHAYTKIGPATVHTVVSPEWFRIIFGDAMALVRQQTYTTNLVLEKDVHGLHEDGSSHFEHFPFQGTTEELAPSVFKHNYWAQLSRPFYTSGRTEVVKDTKPVIRAMPMTFCRVACTFAPKRYWVNGKPIPESVRGIYYGYGHIKPSVLMERGLRMKVGDFQLCARTNPETGKRANTYFYGTFFGKMSDWDGDGKLDVNTRPVHCDESGRLDYLGDGTFAPDPVRPDDWT
jgi:hypothetical protein